MTDILVLPTPSAGVLNKRAQLQGRRHQSSNAGRNARIVSPQIPETPMSKKIKRRRRPDSGKNRLSIEKKRRCPTTSTANFQCENDSLFRTKYNNLGEIGCGSFGIVYKVNSKRGNPSQISEFAVKKSRKLLLTYQQRIMALKEVRIIEKLFGSASSPKPAKICGGVVETQAPTKSHPFIVRYYDSWIEDKKLHITQEYFARGTLKDVLTYNPQLTSKQILYCLLQMIYSLKFVHNKDIIHLDLKPENIFISEDYCLKIGDFGIAHCVDNSGNVDKTISDPTLLMEGDPAYVASELISSHMSLQNVAPTPAADIFSLGVMLYEMLADVTAPLCGETWSDLRNDKIDFTEADAGTLTDALQSICKRMMASNPLDRPSSNNLWAELVDIAKINDIQLISSESSTEMIPPQLQDITLPPPITPGSPNQSMNTATAGEEEAIDDVIATPLEAGETRVSPVEFLLDTPSALDNLLLEELSGIDEEGVGELSCSFITQPQVDFDEEEEVTLGLSQINLSDCFNFEE